MKSFRISLFIIILALSACTLERNAQYGYHFEQKVRAKSTLNNEVSRPNIPLTTVSIDSQLTNGLTEFYVGSNDNQSQQIAKQSSITIESAYGLSSGKKIDVLNASTPTPDIVGIKVTQDTQERDSTLPKPNEKNYFLAALLCLLFGLFGVHWYYLGKKKKGFRRLSLLLLSILSFIGWIALAAMDYTSLIYVISLLAAVGLTFILLVVNVFLVVVDLFKILAEAQLNYEENRQ